MSVLKRILCPIDFDEHSGPALARARDIAVRHGAELRLLHVLPPSRPQSILMPRPAADADGAGHVNLDALAEVVRRSGVPCEALTLYGDPAFQILQTARDARADLIVMATHGRKGVPRVVLGSVTEAVLHATPCPILTIPPRATDGDGAFRRVVCAVDFSPASSGTLSLALAMAEETHGVVTVVNVIDPAFSSRPEDARARAESALGRLHDRVPGEGIPWCELRETVRFGETAREVLKLAAQEDAQLIVVGAHSRRPAVAVMIGSCVDRILRESPCPVLAVPSETPVVTAPLFQPVYA
jgi:nucleotide-binding universal stress UspA family protein